MTNGGAILEGVDGRSAWARRFRDLIEMHTEDLGGEANTSAAERSILRRAATLTTELERLEAHFALNGKATEQELDLYSRVSNTMRRHLEAIGLRRRPKQVLSLSEYLSRNAEDAAEDAAEDVQDAEIVIDGDEAPSPGDALHSHGCQSAAPSDADGEESG
jgi:hypothetical protein